MKSIVAVRGSANSGKSSSVKEALSLLKSKYPMAVVEERFVGVDITIVITINGVKVGIESQGDPNSRLFASLKTFVKIGCHIIVCATRTRGATVNAVDALSATYRIHWIEKTRVPSLAKQAAATSATARAILVEVQAAIDA